MGERNVEKPKVSSLLRSLHVHICLITVCDKSPSFHLPPHLPAMYSLILPPKRQHMPSSLSVMFDDVVQLFL
jgi:hypothetical protein